MNRHKNFEQFLKKVDPDSVFVEIGSEREESSTTDLSNLADKHGVKLISVDIDRRSFDRFYSNLTNKRYLEVWKPYYNRVRSPDWPEDIDNFSSLPDNFKEKISQEWQPINAKLVDSIEKELAHKKTAIQWVIESGSVWSAKYQQVCGQPISLLYLDNFDFIYGPITPLYQAKIDHYKQNFNIEMNNQNCQVEHLSQLINLCPYFSDNCLVGFDDTYQSNGCWVGKNGPGVIYLLTKGWQIIYEESRFLIMQKHPQN